MIQIEYVPVVITGLGLTVSILYYTMNLRTANKARKGQLLMQAYARLDSPERMKAFADMFQWKFDTFEEFIEKYFEGSFGNIHVFFEGMAPLVRLGHIDIEYAAALFGGALVRYWDMMIPIKEDMTKFTYPRWCAETECLYNEVKKFMDQNPEYEY